MIDVFWHLWIVCWVFYRSHLGFLKGLHLPVELAGCSVISDARASLYVQSVNAQQLKLGFFKCEGVFQGGKPGVHMLIRPMFLSYLLGFY